MTPCANKPMLLKLPLRKQQHIGGQISEHTWLKHPWISLTAIKSMFSLNLTTKHILFYGPFNHNLASVIYIFKIATEMDLIYIWQLFRAGLGNFHTKQNVLRSKSQQNQMTLLDGLNGSVQEWVTLLSSLFLIVKNWFLCGGTVNTGQVVGKCKRKGWIS